MQFIISKILVFLYYPFNWIIILVLVACLSRKILIRKRFLKIALAIFIVFSNKFIYNKVSLAYQPKPLSIKSLGNYNAGILLGGIAGYDKENVGYFGQSSDRFIQTLQLYKLGKIKKIIVSGGSSKILYKEKDEASFIYQSFLNCGLDSNDIIIESKARNTEENFIFSKMILDSLNIKNDVIIITSAFHVPRTRYLTKKLGITKCLVFPCNYIETNSNFEIKDYFLPNMKTLSDWGLLIKEWIGLCVYWLKG
jgi:uncharacterized SAM-binding protein YcdF (DUF218 family)